MKRTERGQSMKKAKRRVPSITHVHTGTKYEALRTEYAVQGCYFLVIRARRQYATSAVALKAAGGCVFVVIRAEETRAK